MQTRGSGGDREGETETPVGRTDSNRSQPWWEPREPKGEGDGEHEPRGAPATGGSPKKRLKEAMEGSNKLDV